MGARFNIRIGPYWLELTPLIYIRLNKKCDPVDYKIVYEKWW